MMLTMTRMAGRMQRRTHVLLQTIQLGHSLAFVLAFGDSWVALQVAENLAAAAEGTGEDFVGALDSALEEAGVDVETRLELGIGKCRLSFCVPTGGGITAVSDLDGQRIATSFPNITARYLDERGVSARCVELSGSVEVMVALGVADAIVDLVETGSTLAANRLTVLEDIGRYQAIMIRNEHAADNPLAARIERRLEGVVIARS